MQAAFRLVKPAGNWKLRIDKVISAQALKEAGGESVLWDAIGYYTGSSAEIFPLAGWKDDGSPDESKGWRVLAAGYYACIGS